VAVRLESVGGVDAARRVAAGEAFDAVVLGADALQRLMAGGHVRGFARGPGAFGVAVAVRAGAPQPDIGTEAALKAAVLAARSVGCSTGPSGVALAALFERWGIADAVRAKQVTPRRACPRGRADRARRGRAGLSAAQRVDAPAGHRAAGPPARRDPDRHRFCRRRGRQRPSAEAARALLARLAAPATAAIKQAHGMTPA
jgi:molybdate transport system substrate-binding protein